MSSQVQGDLLTYQQASGFLGVPIGTLYGWVSRGLMTHVRLGPRLVRFSRQALEDLIREQTKQGKQPSTREVAHV